MNNNKFFPWLIGFLDASFNKSKKYKNLRQKSTKITLKSQNFKLVNKNPLFKNNTKDIIVWGTNLTSSIGKPQFTKIISKTIELPHFQFSVLIGLILSDGWVIFSSNLSKNARFGFKQSLSKFKYLWFVFNILSPYCSSHPSLRIGKRNETITYGVEFYSRSLSCFTKLHELFYVNKVKIVPLDIYNLLNTIALAHWIMGDGLITKTGITLCTDSFSIVDVVRLINVLIIRYDLKCTIHNPRKGQYRIHISTKSVKKLRKIVFPYMENSMLHKIHL